MRNLLFSIALALASPATAQSFDAGNAFAGADANGDGNITRAEFIAGREAKFAKFDRNGDGVISKDDFGRLARFRPDAARRIDALISAMDKNGDGKVSRDEMMTAPTPLFDAADVNSNGVVDAQEVAAMRQTLQDRKRSR